MNHSPPTRVLAIPGSLRRGSYNRRLLEAAAQCAPTEMAVDICEEVGSLPLFDEDLERMTDGGPDPVRRLRKQVASADGLLIGTPEYNQSIPGVLKNAIDWLSRPAPDEVLAGKPVAIVGASTGRWGTRLSQSALRQVLTATEALVMPRPMMFVREAGALFDNEGRLTDEATGKQLEAVMLALASWIRLLEPV
jgi:chromate reductase